MRKIIFDLDDTLYRSKELRSEREKAIIELIKNKIDQYKIFREEIGTIKTLKKLGISKTKFFDTMNNVPIVLNKNEKLINILDYLKNNFELVVLSNSSRYCVKETLNQLGILEKFNRIFTGEDFIEEKPHESCFSMIKKEDIAIGNNFEKDLEIPKKFGAKTILIGKNDPRADFSTEYIENIIEIIKNF